MKASQHIVANKFSEVCNQNSPRIEISTSGLHCCFTIRVKLLDIAKDITADFLVPVSDIVLY
jgi:hypothetical protein